MNYNHQGLLRLSNKDKKVIADFVNLRSGCIYTADTIDKKINGPCNKTISDMTIKENTLRFDFLD